MFGIALNQVQHLILRIAELHEVHLIPPLRVPVDGIPSFYHISYGTQVPWCHLQLAESAFIPTVYMS